MDRQPLIDNGGEVRELRAEEQFNTLVKNGELLNKENIMGNRIKRIVIILLVLALFPGGGVVAKEAILIETKAGGKIFAETIDDNGNTVNYTTLKGYPGFFDKDLVINITPIDDVEKYLAEEKRLIQQKEVKHKTLPQITENRFDYYNRDYHRVMLIEFSGLPTGEKMLEYVKKNKPRHTTGKLTVAYYFPKGSKLTKYAISSKKL